MAVGSILSIPNSTSYFIDCISWPVCAILPYKLEYLGFKDYKFRKENLLIKKFNFRKTMKPKLISEETLKGPTILEFYDNAEYSYFTLLMNDFIDLKNKTGFSKIESILP